MCVAVCADGQDGPRGDPCALRPGAGDEDLGLLVLGEKCSVGPDGHAYLQEQ